MEAKLKKTDWLSKDAVGCVDTLRCVPGHPRCQFPWFCPLILHIRTFDFWGIHIYRGRVRDSQENVAEVLNINILVLRLMWLVRSLASLVKKANVFLQTDVGDWCVDVLSVMHWGLKESVVWLSDVQDCSAICIPANCRHVGWACNENRLISDERQTSMSLYLWICMSRGLIFQVSTIVPQTRK